MLIRSEVFRRLGGFDSKFFAHMEEIDLCWRMHLAGYRTVVEPYSTVYHLGGGTLPNNTSHKLYLNYRNNLAMLYKNAPGRLRHITLFVRMFLDAGSALIYFLTGHFDFGRTVFRAHIDYSRWKPELRAQRAEFRARHCRPDKPDTLKGNIYRGSIVLRYILGFRHFGKMM